MAHCYLALELSTSRRFPRATLDREHGAGEFATGAGESGRGNLRERVGGVKEKCRGTGDYNTRISEGEKTGDRCGPGGNNTHYLV